MVQTLIARNADVRAVDAQGHTPADEAEYWCVTALLYCQGEKRPFYVCGEKKEKGGCFDV